jgi:DNA-directed RNA polymerase specialized sigma24 family protein
VAYETQRMLYSPEDAADATQEILICIVTNLASFRGEGIRGRGSVS